MSSWNASPRSERGSTARRAARVALLVVSSVILCAPPARAQPPGSLRLDGLLRAFAAMPGLEAKFVEEKHISLLAQPLTSRGRIYFTKPGLLLRRVEAPRPSDVVVTPAQLRLRDADGERAIDLRERPDLRPFVESLVWILAGDQAALRKVFALQLSPAGAEGGWRLTLTPRGAPLSKLVTTIQIQGAGRAVSQIRVDETNGDYTVTRITDANPARRFSAAERRALFGVGS